MSLIVLIQTEVPTHFVCLVQYTFKSPTSNKQYLFFSATLKETYTTIDAAAGSNFTHPSCSGQLTDLKWTFEASSINSIQRPESDIVTSNKSIRIVNVEKADAGKYTCWTSRCDGHWQKLLTINLCVFTGEKTSTTLNVLCQKFNPVSSAWQYIHIKL